jgi:hypothetical protein
MYNYVVICKSLLCYFEHDFLKSSGVIVSINPVQKAKEVHGNRKS